MNRIPKDRKIIEKSNYNFMIPNTFPLKKAREKLQLQKKRQERQMNKPVIQKVLLIRKWIMKEDY